MARFRDGDSPRLRTHDRSKPTTLSSPPDPPTLPGEVLLVPFFRLPKARLEQLHENLSHARSVVIIGSGTVGIELTGELADAFPGLDITIVESSVEWAPPATRTLREGSASSWPRSACVSSLALNAPAAAERRRPRPLLGADRENGEGHRGGPVVPMLRRTLTRASSSAPAAGPS